MTLMRRFTAPLQTLHVTLYGLFGSAFTIMIGPFNAGNLTAMWGGDYDTELIESSSPYKHGIGRICLHQNVAHHQRPIGLPIMKVVGKSTCPEHELSVPWNLVGVRGTTWWWFRTHEASEKLTSIVRQSSFPSKSKLCAPFNWQLYSHNHLIILIRIIDGEVCIWEGDGRLGAWRKIARQVNAHEMPLPSQAGCVPPANPPGMVPTELNGISIIFT